jgi:hypothetical protein
MRQCLATLMGWDGSKRLPLRCDQNGCLIEVGGWNQFRVSEGLFDVTDAGNRKDLTFTYANSGVLVVVENCTKVGFERISGATVQNFYLPPGGQIWLGFPCSEIQCTSAGDAAANDGYVMASGWRP